MCFKSDSKLERSRRARDKVILRKELTGILGYVGGILDDRSSMERLLLGSKNIPDYLSKIAAALEAKSGMETQTSVEVLGLLSDTALLKMTREERSQDLLDTPTQIVLWFRDYLVRTLDKKDLDWFQNSLKVDSPSASSTASQSALHCT